MNSFCIWLTCTAADKHLITKINNASGNYLWPNIPIGGLHRPGTIEELESMCRTLLSGPRTIGRESSAEISWWPDNFHATIPLFINKCLYKKCHYFPVNLKNRWLVSYFDDKSSTFISDNFFYDLFHRWWKFQRKIYRITLIWDSVLFLFDSMAHWSSLRIKVGLQSTITAT